MQGTSNKLFKDDFLIPTHIVYVVFKKLTIRLNSS